MEFDRLVQVRLHVPGQEGARIGSGYLLAPRLVLTAAHVVGDADTGSAGAYVTVCRPDAGPELYRATVRWRRLDEQADAALVEVAEGQEAEGGGAEGRRWTTAESLLDLRSRPPQRWGTLIGTRPHPVRIAGFPRMQKDPRDGRRLDEQVSGHVLPGSGSLAGRYEVSSTDPLLPVDPPPGSVATPWSGLSGGALLCGELLCGVVRYDRQAVGGTRLTATPFHVLLACPDVRGLLTEHTGWDPVLEPVEPAALLTPAARERDLRSPSMLLRAETEAVAFHGRDVAIQRLEDWCRQGGSSLSVRVLTGPGGQGKTRLARRLAEILREEGWVTGQIRSDLPDTPVPPDLSGLDTSRPLQLTVDYAETRPYLVRGLVEHLRTARHPVRLLLVARTDGEWRTDALQATAQARMLLATAEVDDLAPLMPRDLPAEDRRTAFLDAARDLAALLPAVPGLPEADWPGLAAQLPPPADLSEQRYDSALTLQMTALTALLQNGPDPVSTIPGEPVEATVIRHEQRYWEGTAESAAFRLGLGTRALSRAVAVAVACGAADRAEAIAALTGVPGLPEDRSGAVAEWLRFLYPFGGTDRYWGRLQPDRVGEYHAAEILTGPDVPLPDLLGTVSPGQQAQAITVLARAAVAHHNDRRTESTDRVLRSVHDALRAAPLGTDALAKAAFALPQRAHVLNSLNLYLSQNLSQALRRHYLDEDQSLSTLVTLAVSQSQVSDRLADANRWQDALQPARNSAEIWKRLARLHPDFTAPLAKALNRLGDRLGGLGQWEEGLAATTQALEILERLAREEPGSHESTLAEGLNMHAAQLAHTGRRQEAVNAVDEAIRIQTRLAARDPETHEPLLANLFSNLAVYLAELGRGDEALTARERALAYYVRLAGADPAAFEGDLANAYHHVAVSLQESGRYEQALVPAGQAVSTLERLAANDQYAFAENLSLALKTLAHCLQETGQWDEAVRTRHRTVEVYAGLVLDDPAAFVPELDASLEALATLMTRLGEDEGALAVSRWAVDIYRYLTEQKPGSFVPDLFRALRTYAAALSEAGRQDEALAVSDEEVDVSRRLAVTDPATFKPVLAHSLTERGRRLERAGHVDQAAATAAQAIGILEELVEEDAVTHEAALAEALGDLGDALTRAGRWEEALPPIRRAVEILTRLAVRDRAAHESRLADALGLVSFAAFRAGRVPEALACEEQAVQIRRRQARDSPGEYEPVLARQLTALASRLAALERWEEAAAHAEQAVALYYGLLRQGTPSVEPELAACQNNLSVYLAHQQRPDEAMTHGLQAVELHRGLAERDPGSHAPLLAQALSNLRALRADLGLLTETVATTEELVDVHRRLTEEDPEAFRPEYAAELVTFAHQLTQVGRWEEALSVSGRAVAQWRLLTADGTQVFTSDLADSLQLFASVRAHMARHLPGALAAAREAIRLYRELARTVPESEATIHATRVTEARILDGLGRADEARQIWRSLAGGGSAV